MAFTVTGATLQHTQYLRQILANVPPHYGETHNNRLWLAVGTFVQISQWGKLSEWQATAKEYLRGTREKVEGLRSYGDAIAAFTRSNIYLLTGNSSRNWGVTKIEDVRGATKPGCTIAVRGMLCYESSDGGIYLKSTDPDSPAMCCNIHIEIPGTAEVLTYGRDREGPGLMFRVEGQTLWRADPESLHIDQMGDASLSWFPIDLPFDDFEHVWELKGVLYGVRAGGDVYELDADAGTEGNTMRVTCSVMPDEGQNARVRRMQIVTEDTPGTVKLRRSGNQEAVVPITERMRIVRGGGRTVRNFSSAVVPEDPSVLVVTYESDDDDAALVSVQAEGDKRRDL